MALTLKTGMDGVEQAIEEQKSRGGSRDYIPKIVWDDDKNRIHLIRFLPDSGGEIIPITLDIYNFVNCDDGIKRTFIRPASVGLEEDDWFEKNGILLENWSREWVPAITVKKTVGVSLAVYREEYKDMVDGKANLAIRDVIEKRTYEKDGKEVTVEGPKIGLVQQSIHNFWDNYSRQVARDGHLSYRDYEIEKKGKNKDTKFPAAPMNPIDGFTDEADVLAHYKEHIPMTMEEWILARVATAEVCEPLLGKGRGKGTPEGDRKAQEKREGKGDKPSTRGYDDEPEEAAPSQGRMSSLRDTMTG